MSREGFSGSWSGEESACSAGDLGSTPGSERSSGERIDYPLQHSWASLVAQMIKNPPAMWDIWVRYLGGEDPLEEGWQPTPVFLLENPMHRGAWQATVHGATKSWTWLSD